MPIFTNNILDLVRGTFPTVRKDTMTNLMMPLQKYYALSRLFKDQRMGFSGRLIQEELLTDDNGAARTTGLNSNDVFSEKDGVQLITAEMRHSETSYAYDKRVILAQGDNAAKIYDYLKVKRVQALGSLHALSEKLFWCKPPTATDTTDPYGIFYSLVYGSGAAGFNGGNPTGFSAVYGQDTSVSTNNIDRYRNCTGSFTNVVSTDFLDLFWDAYMLIGFEVPQDLNDFRNGVGEKMQCYTTKQNLKDLKHMMEGRNENLGYDLDKVEGTVTFSGTPIRWVPALDQPGVANQINSASHPFLMINWDALRIRFLEGDYMRDTGPYEMTPVRHNSIGVHVDLSWQTINLDRRRCALLAKADPLA